MLQVAVRTEFEVSARSSSTSLTGCVQIQISSRGCHTGQTNVSGLKCNNSSSQCDQFSYFTTRTSERQYANVEYICR